MARLMGPASFPKSPKWARCNLVHFLYLLIFFFGGTHLDPFSMNPNKKKKVKLSFLKAIGNYKIIVSWIHYYYYYFVLGMMKAISIRFMPPHAKEFHLFSLCLQIPSHHNNICVSLKLKSLWIEYKLVSWKRKKFPHKCLYSKLYLFDIAFLYYRSYSS